MSCGVDEAGRGPAIGPMVVAGVCADRDRLIEIGVKDSKKLSAGRRERLEREIRKVATKIVIRVVEPEEIDMMRENITINEIEVRIFADVINELNCEEVYVDAADVDEERFSLEISKYLKKEVRIISRHKADEIYPEVSAASIIAKVERDRIIQKISQEIGDFGSGYPSDPRTAEFLREYYKKHGKFPPYTRLSWKNVKKIVEESRQKSIDDF